MQHVLAFLIAFIVSLPAAAAGHYEGPMRFSTFWPCDGNGSFCGIRILAEGVIQGDTDRQFSQFLARPKLHKHQLPPVPTIVFDSPGGSVAGGMALGRAIRRLAQELEAVEDLLALLLVFRLSHESAGPKFVELFELRGHVFRCTS